MTCLDSAELFALGDGQFDSAREREVREHLAGCASCRRRERELRQLSRVMPLLLAGTAPVPGPDCPEPATLLDLARHRLAPGEADRVRAHLATCRHCAEELAQIATHPAAEPPAGDELTAIAVARARRLPRWRRRAWVRTWWGAAALAASLAGIYVGLRPDGQPKALPPQSPPAATRRLEAPSPPLPVLLAPREGEKVVSLSPEFRWREVPGALSYTLTLLDRDGEIVWQDNTIGTSLRLPERFALEAGASYFAWVTAALEDGRSNRYPAVGFTAGPGGTP